jgi:hypothetical protein
MIKEKIQLLELNSNQYRNSNTTVCFLKNYFITGREKHTIGTLNNYSVFY